MKISEENNGKQNKYINKVKKLSKVSEKSNGAV